ncbi:MAG: hypothetical protein R3240_00040 [Gammaproteobacteria bacterium]|nr:hypothetical protein [Gammaproteobacteria bacterium]
MANEQDDIVKYKVLADLRQGSEPKALVQKYGIPYPKILRWRRELKKAEEDKSVTDLLDVDKIVIHEAAERVKQDLAKLENSDETKELSKAVDDAVSSLDTLSLLNSKLQATALALLNKISEALEEEVIHTKDIIALASALGSLQTAFFNKAGTQIAIFNGQSSEKEVSRFKDLEA